MAPLAWEKQVTALHLPPFISADLWQFKVLWLIWSVPLTAVTHTALFLSQAAMCHFL